MAVTRPSVKTVDAETTAEDDGAPPSETGPLSGDCARARAGAGDARGTSMARAGEVAGTGRHACYPRLRDTCRLYLSGIRIDTYQ